MHWERELWRSVLNTGYPQNVSAPPVADGRLYVLTNRDLFVREAATGNPDWGFSFSGNTMASPQPDPDPNDGVPLAVVIDGAIAPTVADGVVYVASEDGALYAIGSSAS